VPLPAHQLQSPSKSHWKAGITWGEDHPQFSSPKTKIGWSDAENEYITNWWVINCSTSTKNAAAKLLAHIKTDTAAHRIFHANHTLDSGRIRHGLRKNGLIN
jgi:hypothetical protein